MKYVYAVLVLALIVGGYFFITSQQKETEKTSNVPAGSHVMSDGTVMPNEAMNTENTPEAPAVTPGQATPTNGQASVTIDPNSHVFTVKGVNYGFDVKEIKVKQGETVTINFTSTDGLHDWRVDEFNAFTERVQPGVPTSVTFVANKAGTFEYYCSVGQHRAMGMVGKLIVE